MVGVLLCSSVCQVFDGPASDFGTWGERGYGDGSTPTCDSAILHCFHGCLAFLHRRFPPQSPPSPPLPSIRLSTVNSSPCPGIAPQSLNSSSQQLCLPGDLHCCLGYVWLQQNCLIIIPCRLPQIRCFTLNLDCFFSDSDNCPDVGIGSLLQFPTHRGQAQS